MNKLAIVIPAYKVDFFERSIASVHAQTNKDFNLYVIVDGSKEDFESIFDKYSFKGKVVYHHCKENLGRTDLVAAWNRCLQFLGDEKWVWLFSDDDEMDEHCVQKFYEKLHQTNSSYDLYRFNNVKINENSKVISKTSNHPNIESSESFLRRRLNYETTNFVSEYIFNKKRFYETGGFVPFPAAWATDDATWIQMGLQTGICTIEDGLVKWRQSTKNISGSKADVLVRKQKKKASIMFVNWAYSLSKANRFNIYYTDFLQWLLIMMKIIGYRGHKTVYPISLLRLKTFKLSTLLLNLRFVYKWYTDPDPYWL